MTTIIATRTCIASDSRITISDVVVSGPKLYRKGKAILGIAGDCAASNAFLRWYGTKAERPTFKKKQAMSAVVVTAAGISYFCEDFEEVPISDDFYGVGTGGALALMAMRFYNSTPEEAVAAACSTDINSALPVQVIYLDAKRETV